MIYVIGSLRSPRPREVAAALREDGHQVFDDWQAAGPDADDHWKSYEQSRGKSFLEAIRSPAAQNTYYFDKRNLDACDASVMVLPAGKSAHMETCYVMWHLKKPAYVLLDDSYDDRWDVMYNFIDNFSSGGIYADLDRLRRDIFEADPVPPLSPI